MPALHSRRSFFRTLVAAPVSAGALAAKTPAPHTVSADQPNVILVLCDNLGYGDIGCYGSARNPTPHLDRMAAEGMRFTDFYVTSGVCTPSRASLMTGCYPRRVNLHVNSKGGQVLTPVEPKGLHPDEVTLAEVLTPCGYATACIGKWHLGDQPEFLPTRQGFDSYFGIPYSDDMVERPESGWPPLPLLRNEQVIEAPVDRNTLTQRYTREAVRFIEENKERPFFLYLPQAMPGSTAESFASEAFRGKSGNGTYGDAIVELDWSQGEILAALKRLGLDTRTLVIWTSDNGSVNRKHGSNAPLSGWGYNTSEGAMRVPFIARWPGRIPAGATCDELASTMDLLPTLARLAGAKPPRDRIIDGKDIWPLLAGEKDAASPHEAFYFYARDQLEAVRAGDWKLYVPRAATAREKKELNVQSFPLRLYNLKTDIAEKHNQADKYPDVVRRLEALLDKAREDLGDGPQTGKNQRPAGFVSYPKPLLLQK